MVTEGQGCVSEGAAIYMLLWSSATEEQKRERYTEREREWDRGRGRIGERGRERESGRGKETQRELATERNQSWIRTHVSRTLCEPLPGATIFSRKGSGAPDLVVRVCPGRKQRA